MKTKIWLAVGLFLTVLNIALLGTLAYHWMGGMKPPFPPPGGPLRILSDLNDEDKETIKATLDSFKDSLDVRDEKLREIERQVESLFAESKPNKDSINVLVGNYFKIRQDISENGVEILLNLKEKLPGKEIEKLSGMILFRPGAPGRQPGPGRHEDGPPRPPFGEDRR